VVEWHDVEALRSMLSSLPRHQPKVLSKKQVIAALASEIAAARRHGYPAGDLAQLLSEKGIDVNGPMLRHYPAKDSQTPKQILGGQEAPSLLLLALRGWCTSTSRKTSAPNAFQASRSTPSPIQIHQRFRCAAGKIRTCYPRLRRPVLYPDELQPRT
jgi:hypothetical protein